MGRKQKNKAARNNSVITGSNRLSENGDTLGVGGDLNVNVNQLSRELEAVVRKEEKQRVTEGASTNLLRETLDISSTLEEGVSAIVDDSFTKCFKKTRTESWNFNIYLFPLWFLGVLARYLLIFPIRLCWLAVTFSFFSFIFLLSRLLFPQSALKRHFERQCVRMIAFCWVASWNAVIRCHGPKPVARKGRVWVSNHTSMIDWMVLASITPFATVMQKHAGWLGVVQKYVMDGFGCIYFDRKEAKDRERVAMRIKDYVQNDGTFPLLIFPEGTCVNNRYSTMFKKGAFELESAVCPIAIKYNKIFVDAFWSSRSQSFTMHLIELMTSWAVVADVYFLEPQEKAEGETAIEFASRVQNMIAKKAGLKVVPWNGMLKYFKPSPKLCEQKREIFGTALKQRIEKKVT
jgi:glycerol-3-phosphate O-acyltransferase 3/4